ncbi:hypothetical protein Tco_0615244 [Tanacetum coccineum]
MERAATTASSLEAEQDSGNINRTQSMATLNESFPQGTDLGSGPRCQDTILGVQKLKFDLRLHLNKSYDPPLSKVNTLRSREDNMKLKELMEFCTKLSVRALDIQALVDKKKVIITKKSVRSDLMLEDAEGIECLPNDVNFGQLTLIGAKTTAWNKFSSTMASAIICLATNKKFNFSKKIFDHMMKKLEGRVKFLMYPRPKAKGIVFHDQEEQASAFTPIVSSSKLPQEKDKCKGKMVEPEKPLKKKDQIALDKELALRLHAEEQAELEKERVA